MRGFVSEECFGLQASQSVETLTVFLETFFTYTKTTVPFLRLVSTNKQGFKNILCLNERPCIAFCRKQLWILENLLIVL